MSCISLFMLLCISRLCYFMYYSCFYSFAYFMLIRFELSICDKLWYTIQGLLSLWNGGHSDLQCNFQHYKTISVVLYLDILFQIGTPIPVWAESLSATPISTTEGDTAAAFIPRRLIFDHDNKVWTIGKAEGQAETRKRNCCWFGGNLYWYQPWCDKNHSK